MVPTHAAWKLPIDECSWEGDMYWDTNGDTLNIHSRRRISRVHRSESAFETGGHAD